MGKPARVYDERTAEAIKGMALAGIGRREIAEYLGMSTASLYKIYRKELDQTLVNAKSRLASTAWNMALSGEEPALTIFMCKTRLGWREKAEEQQAPAPVQITIVSSERPERYGSKPNLQRTGTDPEG